MGLRELAAENFQPKPIRSGDVAEYIHHARGSRTGNRRVSMGIVPYTEYWLMNDDQYLGTIQIRHQPSGRHENLKSHIYYHIIPSQRGKGYGTKILQLGLKKARELGLSEVLLTTDLTNIKSRRIIENCGGILLKEVSVPDAERSMLQYRIGL